MSDGEYTNQEMGLQRGLCSCRGFNTFPRANIISAKGPQGCVAFMRACIGFHVTLAGRVRITTWWPMRIPTKCVYDERF